MVTLFDGFRTAVNALKAAGTGLAVTQSNLTNAGIPGYARQIPDFTADGWDPARGFAGGVHSGAVQSARNQFAEQAVWNQSGRKGFYEGFSQAASIVSGVLDLNDVSGSSGIRGSLQALFQSFSQLQAGPGVEANHHDTILKAQSFAKTLSQIAGYLQDSGATARSQIETTVDQINQLVENVHQWNVQMADGGLDGSIAETQVYSNLEDLSALVPITVQKEGNGSLTILMNGQIPLLQGTQQFKLATSFSPPDPSAPFPDAAASIAITTAGGGDVTGLVSGGKLGGLLDYVNRFLPTLLGDSQQQGDLNRLAQGVADSVNSAVGGQLFTYDSSDPLNVARSLETSDSFTATDLASAIATDPGVTAALGQIVSGTGPVNQIDGQSYTDFLTGVGSRAASELNTAANGLDLHTQLLNQQIGLRQDIQGSSLEEEAVNLLQYQRAFEAAARVIGVIDQLTQTTISLGT